MHQVLKSEEKQWRETCEKPSVVTLSMEVYY